MKSIRAVWLWIWGLLCALTADEYPTSPPVPVRVTVPCTEETQSTVESDRAGVVEYTYWLPRTGQGHADALWCELVVKLAGIAAEAVVFGKFSRTLPGRDGSPNGLKRPRTG